MFVSRKSAVLGVLGDLGDFGAVKVDIQPDGAENYHVVQVMGIVTKMYGQYVVLCQSDARGRRFDLPL